MSRCIVTVGVNPQRAFGQFHERFDRTMRKFGDADEVIQWREDWPPGSPSHEKVHYGFKVHAIEEARRRGHTLILWLDVSCFAMKPMAPLWDRIKEKGHFFIIGDDRLGNWSSDHCLGYFGVSRDEAMAIKLFSGTIVGLNLANPQAVEFFAQWKAHAVPEHFNGTHRSGLLGYVPDTEGKLMSSDPRCQGHRADEPYTTLIARRMGLAPSFLGDFFSGGMDVTENCVLRSGYDTKES